MEKFIVYFLILLFPLFFLNITSDILTTNKLYFISLTALILLLTSVITITLSRKINWKKNHLDLPIILFLFGIIISIVVSSSNKIGAITNPYFGLLSILSLIIYYFYLSRETHTNKEIVIRIFAITGSIISIISFVIFLKLFKINVLLGFPIGSNLDLVIFLGFSSIAQFFLVFFNKKESGYIFAVPFIITLVGFATSIYGLTKSNIVFTPFDISWLATIEILKSVRTALFGVGIGNFSTIFTQVKNISFNQTSLWQLNGFNQSHSTILHITTEIGLLGFFSFATICLVFLKIIFRHSNKLFICLFLYLLISLFIFPPSLVMFFLFFTTLALIESNHKLTVVDLSEIPIVYLGIIIFSLMIIGVSGYFLGRAYLAEIYFKKSLISLDKNDGRNAYESLRQAIILNPFDERYLINYSQMNFSIANGLASKPKDQQTKNDQQIISQAIQMTIAYAKSVSQLNPKRADFWANLGLIYRNIIPIAQGADSWAIASYQRSVILDPNNPVFRLNLGGIYYSIKNYDEAMRFFEQAIALKSDWPNAQYNFAWANYQKGNYSQAILAMKNVLNLVNEKNNPADYKKVQQDLEEFKKKFPEEKTITNGGVIPLPSPPSTQISSKLELPKEASLSAK